MDNLTDGPTVLFEEGADVEEEALFVEGAVEEVAEVEYFAEVEDVAEVFELAEVADLLEDVLEVGFVVELFFVDEADDDLGADEDLEVIFDPAFVEDGRDLTKIGLESCLGKVVPATCFGVEVFGLLDEVFVD